MLVDLYQVTRQALRASVPSYSIKEVEALYDFERERGGLGRHRVGGGVRGLARHRRRTRCSRASGSTTRRTASRRSSCTAGCSACGRRSSRGALAAGAVRAERGDGGASRGARARARRRCSQGAEEGEPDWLLAQLLDYHRREARPQWWAYFRNLELDDEELVDGSETIGGLELAGEPVQVKQSLEYTLRFPPQEHKIGSRGGRSGDGAGLPRHASTTSTGR